MKIFITGIAGFIGSSLAHNLSDKGHEVFGIDNFCPYYEPKLKRARAEKLSKERNIETVNIDIRAERSLKEHMKIVRPDMVIHLAAMAGVRYSMNHASEYIDVNVQGTQTLIEAMEKVSVPNVIFASTSCVMHGHDIPWGEPDYLYPQLNPYGYSKMLNESQFFMSKIPNTVGLRFFTVYGPWGRPDMALFDFTRNILQGNPITLFNYGDMRRDFTYVDDIVQGIGCVIDNMTPRDMYSIGNGELVELKRFVEAIENSTGRKALVEYGPKHPADALETLSDTRKLQKLGYQSTTPIEAGVDKFVSWYRSYYNV